MVLKVGIVGVGGMGSGHASRYLQLPNAQITAIADLIPERLHARAPIEINIASKPVTFDFSDVAKFSEARDLIAEADVDVVDICLPTDLHAPYAIQALEAGRHVICEKPMALNVRDAERMVAAAESADRVLMIAQCLRFWPEYDFLRDQIKRQTFGRLLSLNMSRIGGMPAWSPDNWFLDPARSGGALLDLHIHDVDFVNSVLGLPDKIYATGRCSEDSRADNIIHACFSYADGPQVHMHAGWSGAQVPFAASFDAWFDRAFIRYYDGVLTVFEDRDHVTGKVPDYPQSDAYLNEIAYFLHCVEAGEPPTRCHPRSVRDSMALVAQEAAMMAR